MSVSGIIVVHSVISLSFIRWYHYCSFSDLFFHSVISLLYSHRYRCYSFSDLIIVHSMILPLFTQWYRYCSFIDTIIVQPVILITFIEWNQLSSSSDNTIVHTLTSLLFFRLYHRCSLGKITSDNSSSDNSFFFLLIEVTNHVQFFVTSWCDLSTPASMYKFWENNPTKKETCSSVKLSNWDKKLKKGEGRSEMHAGKYK